MFRDHDITKPRDKMHSLLGLLNEMIGSRDKRNGVTKVAKELKLEQRIIVHKARVEDIYASLVVAMVQEM